MPAERTCALGHTWTVDESGQGDVHCPTCGGLSLPKEDSPATVVLRARRDVTSPYPDAATLPVAPTAFVATPAPAIPGYEILGELGRGGMGVVYKARQLALNRVVAVKMIHAAPGSDPDQFTRLKAEAEAIARLQHPNIIQVFEVGACPAGPFLVMEFAAGGSLARRLDGSPQPPGVAARMVEALARAVHAAHQAKVVHRDLKPGNVQVVEDDAVPLDRCTLKISDFGLARRLDESGSLTLSGQVIGTPGYMPPEQARRGGSAVGPAADIYALGVLLYETLTGRPPFHGSTAMETVHLMLSREPLPPSRLRKQLPRDLETICLKCLHKDPARRYPDAQAMADDLARFLAGRPVKARPTPAWERAGMWARRQPGTAALVAGCAAAVLVSFALLAWQWRRAEAAHAQSEVERETAEQLAVAEAGSRRQAQALASRLLLERGATLCEAGDYPAGLLWLARGLENAPAEDHDLQQSLRQLIGGWSRHLHLYRYHARAPGPVAAVAFRGDAKVLAFSSGSVVRLADAASGSPLDERAMPGDVLHLAAAGPGLVAVARAAAGLRVVDLGSGQPLGPDVPTPAAPRSAALTPDGAWLLVGFDDHRARLYRVETGRQEGPDWPHAGAVRAAAFSPDGRLAATGSNDHVARVWDVGSGRLLLELREHTRPVPAVAFSLDGALLATGGEDRRVVVWDAVTGVARHRLTGHEKDVYAVAFHPTRPLVAGGGEDHTARVWDILTGAVVGAPVRHCRSLAALAFSPDGTMLATGGDDHTVRVWKPREPSQVGAPLQHDGPVRTLAVAPDGRSVLTAGSRVGLRLWSLQSRESRPGGHYRSTVLKVAFAPAGNTFVAGQFDRHAQVYDAERLAPVGEPWKHGAAVLAVAVSPDGRLVATGCDDQDLAIRLHDAATGRVVRTLTGHTRKVVSLAFSPDGKRLVSGSWDRTARLWDVATGEPVGQPLQHLDLVQAVAFSPDGSLILTGADDYMTRLWNADALQLRGAALRHPDKVQAVAFSPDGLLFATGDKAGHVGLWETRTSKRLGVGARHGGEVHSLAFTPDGKMLLSGGWDGLVHRLRVPTEVWLEPLALRRWLERHTSQTLIEPGVITPLSLGAWEQRALDPTSK